MDFYPSMAAALLVASTISHSARAQAPDPETSILTAEQVKSDLETLYLTLAEAHYDLFAHRSKAQYDALYTQLRGSLPERLTPTEAALLFQEFVAFGKIGHAKTDAHIQRFMASLQAGGQFLPLFIRVDGDKVFLTSTAEATGTLRAGIQITAIDGEPVAVVLARLSRLVSAEREYMAHAQLEESFPVLLSLGRKQNDPALVEARIGGSIFSVPVVPVTFEQYGKLVATFPTPTLTTDLSTRDCSQAAPGVAYLRPGPFFNTENETGGSKEVYDVTAFRTFIDGCFNQFLANGSGKLIIDLRRNPGGDNSFSDPMIAWFARRPFRFTPSFQLKASAATKAEYARISATELAADPALAARVEAEKLRPNGTRYTFALPKVQPRAKPRFSGKVWVLIDRHSYSNATVVAALVQDYRFGKILGEETADLPTTYASAQTFTLPISGVVVTYPKSRFLRPSRSTALRGVVPDIALARPAIGETHDVVLEQALQLVLRSQ